MTSPPFSSRLQTSFLPSSFSSLPPDAAFQDSPGHIYFLSPLTRHIQQCFPPSWEMELEKLLLLNIVPQTAMIPSLRGFLTKEMVLVASRCQQSPVGMPRSPVSLRLVPLRVCLGNCPLRCAVKASSNTAVFFHPSTSFWLFLFVWLWIHHFSSC